MKLEILTPEKVLFSGEVISVTLPGTLAPFQILNRHAPIISSLSAGKITFWVSEGNSREIGVGDGFVEMSNNIVTVCVDSVKEQ